MTVEADPLRGNAVLVDALGSALRRGGNALDSVPDLLKRVLAEGSWRDFITQRGEVVHHARFVDFVTEPPLRGIGGNVPLVRRVVEVDPVALDLLDEALRNPEGGSIEQRATVANRNSGRPSGTSKAYALRRLRKDAPQLHSEVLAGRLTAHAAMVQAGLRSPTFTMRAGSAEQVANVLKAKLPEDVLNEVARRLMS